MTDTLRNMPRYIRNTDAFGWQGADGPGGPWRSITPPQSGAPWQTTTSMADITPNDLSHLSDDEFTALCPHDGHAPGPEPLSPAAQAVMNAATNGNTNVVNDPVYRQCIAAALRAAADQMASHHSKKFLYSISDCLKLRDIASELENHQ